MSEEPTATCAEELLQALKAVIDPELGFNIVDLGLVRRAVWQDGAIEVAITPTSPSCPVTQLLIYDAEDALRRRFPDARSIRVELVWDPPWTADRLSEEARLQLGLLMAEPD
ncbi:MAG: metal-sulfur cluster assembly factor [Bradyrhizobiaceae bacterium]|nr:metal-sulfur cluster assembly factor [Bradyrhizobiaceae bacterium]